MDPKKRTLLRVVVVEDERKNTDSSVERLMGTSPKRASTSSRSGGVLRTRCWTFKAGFGSAAQYERRSVDRLPDHMTLFLVPPCSSMNCLGMTAWPQISRQARQRTDRSRCT